MLVSGKDHYTLITLNMLPQIINNIAFKLSNLFVVNQATVNIRSKL